MKTSEMADSGGAEEIRLEIAEILQNKLDTVPELDSPTPLDSVDVPMSEMSRARTKGSRVPSIVEQASLNLQPMLKLKKSDADLKHIKRKSIRDYYVRQNELLEKFELAQAQLAISSPVVQLQQESSDAAKPKIDGHVPKTPNVSNAQSPTLLSQPPDQPAPVRQLNDKLNEMMEGDERESWLIKLAIYISFFTNVVLLAFKILAFALSGLLVILASAIDSALDLLSGSIIFVTHRLMQKRDIHHYPVGKTRYENLGIIVFASVMGMASLQVIVESIRVFTDYAAGKMPVVVADAWSLGILISTVIVKFLLWIFCRLLASKSASCETLAQDHLNDVLTNGVSTLLVFIIQQTNVWWLDPTFAILLSLYIIFNWAKMGKYHLTLLAGRSTDTQTLAQFTYFAANFHPKIQLVDTVRAYHAGQKLFVEVDIVMAPETTLRVAHDIGEALQKGFECFPNVERAFVHLDYEAEHYVHTEHRMI